MSKTPEKWPVIADNDIIRGGLGLVTEKSKKKTKAEQENAQPISSRFNYRLLFNFHTLYEFRLSDWLICTT